MEEFITAHICRNMHISSRKDCVSKFTDDGNGRNVCAFRRVDPVTDSAEDNFRRFWTELSTGFVLKNDTIKSRCL